MLMGRCFLCTFVGRTDAVSQLLFVPVCAIPLLNDLSRHCSQTLNRDRTADGRTDHMHMLVLNCHTYFANSTNAPVALEAFSFCTSNMFRGGSGQCKESRSF